MTGQQKIQAKRYVDIWKQTAVELDRIKCEEVRAMTEQDRRQQATDVMEMGSRWLGATTALQRPSGLVEQQRIFSRWRNKAP